MITGRREFIALVDGASVWPATARAQQSAMPVIGFLGTRSPDTDPHLLAAFRQGLGEIGYVEGRNVAIEYRWAEGQYDRLPALAADLVNRRVAAIAALTTPAAHAAKAATTTIPIVFLSGGDPVKSGLVTSLSKPGRNITGQTGLTTAVAAKRLEMAHELVPAAAVIALLVNPTNPQQTAAETSEVGDAARALGLQLYVLNASNDHEISAAFATLVQQRAGALLVSPEPFLNGRNDQIVALASRHEVPVIYGFREFTSAGGLMSYGVSQTETTRMAGIYTGKILKGAKPADLPVEQSAKVELVINLKTAKALGLLIPPTLLARADELIE
jgi:ABC-type uncharacterized transport system substrate-binding protein